MNDKNYPITFTLYQIVVQLHGKNSDSKISTLEELEVLEDLSSIITAYENWHLRCWHNGMSIEALDRGAPGELGAFPIDGGDDHAVRFMPEAQEYFISWLTDLENLLSRDDEHEALIAHLAKYRSLMPSLALIFHLIDVAGGQAQPGNVSLEATQRAGAWTAYLESHARRIYGMALNAELGAASLMMRFIRYFQKS